MVALPAAPPSELAAAGTALLAARPGEIDFVEDGGVRGVVARRAYLGKIVDFRVSIGDPEIRMQKTRHEPAPAVGDQCELSFRRPRWCSATD